MSIGGMVERGAGAARAACSAVIFSAVAWGCGTAVTGAVSPAGEVGTRGSSAPAPSGRPAVEPQDGGPPAIPASSVTAVASSARAAKPAGPSGPVVAAPGSGGLLVPQGPRLTAAPAPVVKAPPLMQLGLPRRPKAAATLVWPRIDPNPNRSGSTEGVAFSPNGKVIATGDSSGKVRTWDVATGKPLRTIDAHAEKVSSVAFSPDGKLIASTSPGPSLGFGGGTKIWNAHTGALVHDLGGLRHGTWRVRFSPSGKLAAMTENSPDYEQIRIVRVKSGANERLIRLPEFDPWSLAFSPDGSEIATVVDKHDIGVYGVFDGKLKRRLRGHKKTVWGICWPRADLLASTSTDGTTRLWDPRAGGLKRTLEREGGELACSPDGTLIVVGRGSELVAYDATGQPLGPLPGHERYDGVGSLAVSPDGMLVAGGSTAGWLRLWRRWRPGPAGLPSKGFDLHGEPLPALVTARLGERDGAKGPSSHGEEVTALDISADGSRVVTAADDGTVRLWKSRHGEPVQTLTVAARATAVRWLAGGKDVLIGLADGSVLDWDVAGSSLTSVGKHAGPVATVDGSHDGAFVASGADEEILIRHRLTGIEVQRLDGVGKVTAVRFGPRSARLAVAGDRVVVFDLPSGRASASTSDRDPPRSLRWGHGGRALVRLTRGDGPKVWDLASNETRSPWLSGSSYGLKALAVAAQAPIMAVGSETLTVIPLDKRATHRLVKYYRQFSFHALALSADGMTLVSNDGHSALVWDVRAAMAGGAAP